VTVQIFARDAALRRTGQVQDFRNLTMPLRFNRTGAWVLELDVHSPAVPLLGRTDGLIVERDGVTLLSGPVVGLSRTSDGDRDTVVVNGVDDTVWLERRLALPDPFGPPYTSAAYDSKQGLAETVLRWYVDRNLGPSATPTRRLPYLTLPADLGRGSTVRGFGRFHTLLELLQPLALAGGDLGFRIVQVDGGLEFQVGVPADRTATAVFSRELGNLAGYNYSVSAPAADYVIVAGQGEGTARAFAEGGTQSDIDVYGRIEQFRDRRDIEDPAVLPQALGEALAEAQPATALSIKPIDTPAVTFGVDYNLGDRVSVLVDGEEIQDIVREVTLTLTPERGEQVTPLVGTPGATSPQALALFARQERLDRRVSNQERR
jgi:hypothetical protein